MTTSTSTEIAQDKTATEYLANERTYLAWVRTSVAIMSLGFVVAKFDVWLNMLATRIGTNSESHSAVPSTPVGLAMIGLGGVMVVLAAWRYEMTNRAIARGSVTPNRWLAILIALAVAVLSVALVLHVLLTLKIA